MRFPQLPLKWSWSIWIAWTAMLIYLLLWPSKGTAVQRISLFFGGSDITDALGHLVLIFVETNLTYSLVCYYLPQAKAVPYVFIGTLIFAWLLEAAQLFIPGRGAALIDLVANTLGVSLFSLFTYFLYKTSK